MSSAKENGVYFLERGEYERLPRVNWSTLKHIGRSPAHYNAALLTPYEDTDAMKRGRAAHLAVFEPDQFKARCVVWEGKVRRGNDWEAFVDRHPDDEILTPAMYEDARAIGEAVRNHPVAQRFISGGKGEVTVLWDFEGPDFKVPCKSRLDFVAECEALVDLKTTRHAGPEAFGRQCAGLEYHVQAAFYRHAYARATGRTLPYYLVAVEAQAPHVVQAYRVTDEQLDLGEQRFRELLETYHQCRERSRWPGYADDVLDLTLPRWAVPSDDSFEDLGITIGSTPAIGFGQ